MPKGYAGVYHDRGSVGEQLLGEGSEKRNTKTFIEDGPLAMFLGLVRGLPDAIINTGRNLMAEEMHVAPDSISIDEIFRLHPEARELIDLHQQIIEHKGSQGGYLVDRYTQRANRDEIDSKEPKKESSGDHTQNKRWS